MYHAIKDKIKVNVKSNINNGERQRCQATVSACLIT